MKQRTEYKDVYINPDQDEEEWRLKKKLIGEIGKMKSCLKQVSITILFDMVGTWSLRFVTKKNKKNLLEDLCATKVFGHVARLDVFFPACRSNVNPDVHQ